MTTQEFINLLNMVEDKDLPLKIEDANCNADCDVEAIYEKDGKIYIVFE